MKKSCLLKKYVFYIPPDIIDFSEDGFGLTLRVSEWYNMDDRRFFSPSVARIGKTYWTIVQHRYDYSVISNYILSYDVWIKHYIYILVCAAVLRESIADCQNTCQVEAEKLLWMTKDHLPSCRIEPQNPRFAFQHAINWAIQTSRYTQFCNLLLW